MKNIIILNHYYKNKYQKKVYKIPLNGGFTCPNIDGTVATGGCTFLFNLWVVVILPW